MFSKPINHKTKKNSENELVSNSIIYNNITIKEFSSW